MLALGAQRLLPSLQQIYFAWASIAGYHASMADTIALLDQPLPREFLEPVTTQLPIQNEICLNNVRFRYTEEDPWVLDDLNLVITKGSKVGLVGFGDDLEIS